jgi:hypothetical protein
MTRNLARVKTKGQDKMKAAIVHSHIPTAEVLARAISSQLHADVTTFSCVENLLASSMDYSAFVVYNNFGHKMTGMRGVTLIKDRKSRAFIVGVSYKPDLERQFLSAGADVFVLRAGNEVEELVTVIQKYLKTTLPLGPASPAVNPAQNRSEKQASMKTRDRKFQSD